MRTLTASLSLLALVVALPQCGPMPATGGGGGNMMDDGSGGVPDGGATGGGGDMMDDGAGDMMDDGGGKTDGLCTDTCAFAGDGECDDGGPGADFAECALGTDCMDCGPRVVDDESDVLFVVSSARVTSYLVDTGLNGDIAPNTRIDAGAATSLFQPRPIVVTRDNVLLVGRQNGGIVGYEDALLTSDAPADRVVDGGITLLESPNAFAYDAKTDRLFVGNVPSDDGMLVFDNVSAAGFDGDIAPDRTFGPGDRIPFGTGSIAMAPRSMCFDSAGNLYVADTSGSSVNQTRILVFANPGSAEDLAEPIRTFTSTSWDQIEDIEIDANGVFYAVDGGDFVVMFDGVTTLEGTVEPSRTLVPNADRASFDGIEVSSTGTGYLSDRQNSAVYTFDAIATLSGTVAPDAALEGFETRLSGTRHMWLVER